MRAKTHTKDLRILYVEVVDLSGVLGTSEVVLYICTSWGGGRIEQVTGSRRCCFRNGR